jgi:nucleoside phosphorylase
MDSNDRTYADYTIGWVCALPQELTAAKAMLDQKHGDLCRPSNDCNTYILGSIGRHNIVIACLPKGKPGTISAASVAVQMIRTFPAVRFGLMLGIGGGVPPKVRLGDVVVGVPSGQHPGVIQWDMGKADRGGQFQRIGALNNSPASLLTALTNLESDHEMLGSRIPEFLDELEAKYPRLASRYLRRDLLADVLYKPDYHHIDGSRTLIRDENDDEAERYCRYCDRTQVVKRRARDMCIHYGLIASGNQVIKDAQLRDTHFKSLGEVLCIEMEAAGLIANFPCIVIRGISDYADSHKNNDWQEHAAAVAAAYAKELLGYIQPAQVASESAVKDVLDNSPSSPRIIVL